MGHCVSRRIGSAAVCGLCLLLAFGGLGCARREPVPVAQAAAPSPPPPAPAREVVICKIERETAYDRGLKAYEAGESKRAMALWREAAGDAELAVRQKALFAMASVKLSQAGSDAELAAALEMFDAWSKKSPPGGSGEDARFLVPLLKAYKPAFTLKEQKAAMDRDCAKKLAEREEQVRKSLQQQVKALETIHQQIQEKKKGLSNY
ncbi:hypothetical protein [Solidesulfovibrio carbinolicus]|uniref:Uncharacterized protein n=1 Tax=Solidesulfovibrio carbinolicus TaxID=296842 RepID=A0A4P6HN40_9BACT|nr:hypothetical protein [Solidesulfovibrio carbinolicus]QAZ67430.1 hypothetical protein C3Y92_09425 [Solidesulfovibrio carbinolicus]